MLTANNISRKNILQGKNFELETQKISSSHLPIADCPDLMTKASSCIFSGKIAAIGTTGPQLIKGTSAAQMAFIFLHKKILLLIFSLSKRCSKV